MSFSPEDLLATLAEFEGVAGPPARLVVAFSGGLDSSVLLNALAETVDLHGKTLVAVHVNHRLQAPADDWAAHCRSFATRVGAGFETEIVTVATRGGRGPEASARDARYSALERHVRHGDWLLTAHHRDDQAETLLGNLFRGSGPRGIAGIEPLRPFGRGWLARPLLQTTRAALATYARARGIHWIDDPSNSESRFDRNFLRNEVLPLIESRWPGAAARLARSAAHAREATRLADEIGDADIVRAGGDPARMSVSKLLGLSPARRNNTLRRAVQRLDLPALPAKTLASIVDEVLAARADATPLVGWSTAEARRYRDSLYLMPALADPRFAGLPLGRSPVDLGSGLGALCLVDSDGPGLSERAASTGLTLETRQGGETICLAGQSHTRKLKKLLQEEGIVPWMRERLPLVYSGSTLVAVADLWLADGHATNGGLAIRWTARPVLY